MKKILTCSVFALLVLGLSAQDPAIKVIQNGNVGVGKADPEEKLDVNGNIMMGINNYLVSKRTDGRFHQMIGLDAFNSVVFNRSSLTQGKPSALLFGIGAGRVFDMRNGQNQPVFRLIEATGNVGIGTINPDQKLTVNGGASKPGGGMWSVFSGAQVVSDNQPFTYGLETVLQIDPVFFKYNGKLGLPQDQQYVGVDGNHMQEIAPFMIKETSTQDSKGRALETVLSYDGTALPYMLVNAVKEQQEIIQDQEDRIQELENKLDALLSTHINEELAPIQITLDSKESGVLGQNRPNPFDEITIIDYTLPSNIESALMEIMTVNGRLLKSVDLGVQGGKAQLKIDANDLPAGSYYYQLVVDGESLGSKKMIKSR